jgi:hypothetical protein
MWIDASDIEVDDYLQAPAFFLFPMHFFNLSRNYTVVLF